LNAPLTSDLKNKRFKKIQPMSDTSSAQGLIQQFTQRWFKLLTGIAMS
jgi:hypothetical protein